MIAKQIICARVSTAAVERYFGIAGYILSSRRTRWTDESLDHCLFANVNFQLYDVVMFTDHLVFSWLPYTLCNTLNVSTQSGI